MPNKTFSKSQLLYLSPEDDKTSRNAAEKIGISIAGFWRMILREWVERHKNDSEKK